MRTCRRRVSIYIHVSTKKERKKDILSTTQHKTQARQMSENTDPLIPKAVSEGEGEGGRWLKKIVDWEEGKKQLIFSVPMILTNASYYAIPLTSVMFAGHLGDVELAASNLANSWANVTGFSFMVSTYLLQLVIGVCGFTLYSV